MNFPRFLKGLEETFCAKLEWFILNKYLFGNLLKNNSVKFGNFTTKRSNSAIFITFPLFNLLKDIFDRKVRKIILIILHIFNAVPSLVPA